MSVGLIWIDYLLLGIVVLSGVVGLFRGFVKEALSLGVWIAAIWCAWKFAGLAADQMSGWVAEPVLRLWAARAVVLVAVLIAGGLLTALLSFLLDQTGLTGTDRLLGGIFGLGRGAVLVAIVVIALQFTGFDESSWWPESKLIPYAEPVVAMLLDVADDGMEMLNQAPTPVATGGP
jgi:membrane protein required for colicin V production